MGLGGKVGGGHRERDGFKGRFSDSKDFNGGAKCVIMVITTIVNE
jgi:hypothetical protein